MAFSFNVSSSRGRAPLLLTGGLHFIILAIAGQADTPEAWPWALLAMSVVSFFAWLGNHRRYRQIHDLPTSKVASAAQGYVELLGIGGAVKALATDGALTISLADGNDHPFDAQTRTGELRVEVGVDFDGVVKMHSTGGRLDVRDSAGRTRVPNAGDHSKTVEVGAASDQSELRSTTGAVRLTVRAK